MFAGWFKFLAFSTFSKRLELFVTLVIILIMYLDQWWRHRLIQKQIQNWQSSWNTCPVLIQSMMNQNQKIIFSVPVSLWVICQVLIINLRMSHINDSFFRNTNTRRMDWLNESTIFILLVVYVRKYHYDQSSQKRTWTQLLQFKALVMLCAVTFQKLHILSSATRNLKRPPAL